MNKLNIAATGYPGTTESWKFLHEMSADLAAIIGQMIHRSDPVIITGCNITDGYISDGYITYAGEVYRFINGTATDTVVLVEEVTNAEYYEDISDSGTLPNYPTYIRRYAKCGNPGEGFTNVPLGDFARLSEVVDIDERTKPATEDTSGIVEIATHEEVIDGTDDTRVVTPQKLNNRLEVFKEVITLGSLSKSGDYSGSTSQSIILSGTVILPDSYSDYIITGSPVCDITAGGAYIKNIIWYTRNREATQFDIYCEVEHAGLNTEDYSINIRIDFMVIKP